MLLARVISETQQALVRENIDEIILSCLSSNARISAREISNKLASNHIKRSPRAVLKRIKKLENDGRIRGYTLKSPGDFSDYVIRLILISLKASKTLNKDVRRLNDYLQKLPYTAFAARTRGEYDWITIKIFPNSKIANDESDTYRTTFGHVTERYTVFDLYPVKSPDFIQPLKYRGSGLSRFHQTLAKK